MVVAHACRNTWPSRRARPTTHIYGTYCISWLEYIQHTTVFCISSKFLQPPHNPSSDHQLLRPTKRVLHSAAAPRDLDLEAHPCLDAIRHHLCNQRQTQRVCFRFSPRVMVDGPCEFPESFKGPSCETHDVHLLARRVGDCDGRAGPGPGRALHLAIDETVI